MTFTPKKESRHRHKENKNQTLLTTQNHLSERSLTYMKILLRITALHSFTRTWIIVESNTIEGANVIKNTITETHQFSLIKTKLQVGIFNKTTILLNQKERRDMSFNCWNFYFLHQHSHLSPTICSSN